MAEVRLLNVTKKFQNTTAVEKINLTVRDKEFLVLVGPSGCGKSTTLRMIAGLEEVSEGEIYIGDGKVNEVPAKDRDIAMVFQNYALYPHINVYKNMAFGLRLRKFRKDEIEARVFEAAKILGIEELLGIKHPILLSGVSYGSTLRLVVAVPEAGGWFSWLASFTLPMDSEKLSGRVVMNGPIPLLLNY